MYLNKNSYALFKDITPQKTSRIYSEQSFGSFNLTRQHAGIVSDRKLKVGR
jgi:hypothetical protein